MDEHKGTESGEASARATDSVGLDANAIARACADAIEREGLPGDKIEETRLIPLWYCPFMFCGTPGKPKKLPSDRQTLGKCFIRWASEIARAVNDEEIWTRDPAGWMVQYDAADVTPESLVAWAEFDQWARNAHGLNTGYLEFIAEFEKHGAQGTTRTVTPPQRGRKPEHDPNVTGDLFGALGEVMSETTRKDLEDKEQGNAFTDKVLNKFSDRTGKQPHSHAGRWVKAFIERYMAPDRPDT